MAAVVFFDNQQVCGLSTLLSTKFAEYFLKTEAICARWTSRCMLIYVSIFRHNIDVLMVLSKSGADMLHENLFCYTY